MITAEILEAVAKARLENPRITYRQLAEEHLQNADYASVLRKAVMDTQRGSELAAQASLKRSVLPQPLTKKVASMPAQYVQQLAKPTEVIAKDALIIADLHLPHADRALIAHIVETGRKKNINTLVIAGDAIDGQFTGKHKNPPEYVAPAKIELEYLQRYLRYFESCFSEVVILPGNHDEWVLDYFDYSFDEFIYTLLPENSLTISQYSYVYLNNDLVIGHLEEWNEKPGYLAWKIGKAMGRNALVGHDHIRGVYTENGSPVWGASLGATLVSDNIYYKRASFNSFPAFQCGYAELTNYNELTLYAWDSTTKTARPENILNTKVLR